MLSYHSLDFRNLCLEFNFGANPIRGGLLITSWGYFNNIATTQIKKKLVLGVLMGAKDAEK